MPSEPSVHDNTVYAYSVDCESRRLTLHTAYREREPQEFTDVIFREVVAHRFEHVLPSNLLFGIVETEVAAVVQEHEETLVDSWRYGWPPVEYRGDLEALIQTLEVLSTRAYSITSSYGLSGWVLAGSCERAVRSEAVRIE